MSNPTHPPDAEDREPPVYFTKLEGNRTQRRTQTPASRLLDCQDEIRRLRDLLTVLDDAFYSEMHGRIEHLGQYGALSRHLGESLHCLSAELGDVMGQVRQAKRPNAPTI